jgi:hypothetical protein
MAEVAQYAAVDNGYVLRIFSYLKTHDRSRLVFDHKKRDCSHSNFTDYDWKDQYPGKEDESPPGMPEAFGKLVQINFFCDAANAQDLLSQQEIADLLGSCSLPSILEQNYLQLIENKSM